MSVSFRKFVEFIDQEEISDEQINELFGKFATSRVDKIKAKRDEVRARLSDSDREEKWKQAQAKTKLNDPTLSPQEKEELRKKAWGAKDAPRSGGTSTASRERAGEVEWQTQASKK